ncbi:MAG: hypothetical protein SOU51_03875 [Collinsella sp.]|nr:hypothetical protein [Collinsella sp.]
MHTIMCASREREQWRGYLLTMAKVGCCLAIAGGIAYLAVAGVFHAVTTGLHVEAEIQGTRVVVAYCAVMFALQMAVGLVGLWASISTRYMRVLAIVAALPTLGVLLCLATSMFGVTDSAFNAGFLRGFNLFFGVMSAGMALLALGLWKIDSEDVGEEASDEDDDAEEDEGAESEDPGLDWLWDEPELEDGEGGEDDGDLAGDGPSPEGDADAEPDGPPDDVDAFGGDDDVDLAMESDDAEVDGELDDACAPDDAVETPDGPVADEPETDEMDRALEGEDEGESEKRG